MHAHHDMGGQPAGLIDQTQHTYQPWKKRTHAILLLLAEPCRALMNVDQLRRGIEGLGEREYDRLTYYERWIVSIANNLVQRGVFTVDELGRKLAEIEAHGERSETMNEEIAPASLPRKRGELG